MVQQAYWQLPDSLRDSLDNLDIIVEDVPGPEAEGALDHEGHDHGVADHAGHDHDGHGHGGNLLGLYVGVPLVERFGYDPMMPDCIYIYRLPTLDVCETQDDVVREIRTTLLHEIGHYLGLSEDDLDRLGYA